MNLKSLLNSTQRRRLEPRFRDLRVASIHSDSRKVSRRSLFVALKGTEKDGADFIAAAIDKGARVIAADRTGHSNGFPADVCFLNVTDPHRFLRAAVPRFYGYPSRRVKTIGVTGTNGKTTVTYLMEAMFKAGQRRCGIIGTINSRIGRKEFLTQNTTPGFVENQQFLSECVRSGAAYCVMEVSSHALDQGRVDGIEFKTAVFTNLTRDHLDYHRTRKEYFAAKAKLFLKLKRGGLAVINTDDAHGRRLLAGIGGRTVTYGFRNHPDYSAGRVQLEMTGSRFDLKTPEGIVPIQTPLIGGHNIYNICAAAAAAVEEKIPLELIRHSLQRFAGVPGRLERVETGRGFHLFIDYAHTPHALENVLRIIRRVCPRKIILVFGCGGDRDQSKRPQMGRIAGQGADFSIVTDDNPRRENPRVIRRQVTKGFQNHRFAEIGGRREAIHKALKTARTGDVVILAGKGHETCQIYGDRKVPFSERSIVEEALGC